MLLSFRSLSSIANVQLQYKRWTAIVVLSISLELFIIVIVLRMLFMLQQHWTGKVKAIVVFTLRLPSVQLSIDKYKHTLMSLHAGLSSSPYTDFSHSATSVPLTTLFSIVLSS